MPFEGNKNQNLAAQIYQFMRLAVNMWYLFTAIMGKIKCANAYCRSVPCRVHPENHTTNI